CLNARRALDHWKAQGLDLSAILHGPELPAGAPRRRVRPQDHRLEEALDNRLIEACREALEHGRPVSHTCRIRNVHRAVGTRLGYEVTRRWGGEGLPDDTIRVHCLGSAGQSFGAFIPRGITLTLEGDSNDYLGKGLSGGKLLVYPPQQARFAPEVNVITGNVALYGATSGEAYIRGVAGERFAVRNSGAWAVVEGVGDHGCEYMTGGRVVVLGPTGRNFAAGMSGGIAYVWNIANDFDRRCNLELVDLEPLERADDIQLVRALIERHIQCTGSAHAARLLCTWNATARQFIKGMPRDYKRVLQSQSELASVVPPLAGIQAAAGVVELSNG